MATFVLVSGPFTGGWVWDEVTARLQKSGAEVYPVTLTGMGDPAGPDTDLETHIEDLVRLIDRIDAPGVVLVGHDYGIHPVLGAADRRPVRIARIVYLDAGMPRDGDPALAFVPDQEVRERLSSGEGGPTVPPPSGDGWEHWGSTDGIPVDALDRLDRLSVPQPSKTLTQPLRLSGSPFDRAVTGVLCTANGSSLAMVEMAVASGPPQFRVLAGPEVTFFELGTGHWPMLSAPEELAGVLLRAAVGEGHRVSAPAEHERPQYLGPFLMDVAEAPRERIGRVDLHLPADLPDADHPRPAVVFVHGGPISPDQRPGPRDWPMYVGYSRLAASMGAIGVMPEHRLHGLADYARAAEDLAEAVELVRADPRVDEDRVALWFFSAGGLLSSDWLAAPPPWLRCVAMSYPVLAPPPGWTLVDSRFRPASTVGSAGALPIVLTRVGLEHDVIATTVEEFLTAAGNTGADVEVIDVPLAHHGFETIDHSEQTRDAVDRAARSVLGHLLS
ncbi:alpha/beta hydrolase [Streptomyces vilmorinianum]|uniref:alpha/beta hydrolase n=1 Tax=Streptomyces vilmorinianum TaxID=3051092 RepID=UPI0010FB0594|nr:alpha/beta hydrolase [Streptomyces vilmorinianum]